MRILQNYGSDSSKYVHIWELVVTPVRHWWYLSKWPMLLKSRENNETQNVGLISQTTWLLIKWYIQNMNEISLWFHQKKSASLSLVVVYHSGNNLTRYWNSHVCTDICIQIHCCIQYTNSCVNRSCNSPVIKPRGIQYNFGYSWMCYRTGSMLYIRYQLIGFQDI